MATVKFSDEMPKPTSIKGTDRFLISDGVTGEAKAPDFNQAKEYLNVTGIEMEPLVGGTTSGTALVVPNGPAGEQRTAEVSSGKWYDFGSGPVEASADRRWKSYWNGTSWVLKDMGELPIVPVTDNVVNNTGAVSGVGVEGYLEGLLVGNGEIIPTVLAAGTFSQTTGELTNSVNWIRTQLTVVLPSRSYTAEGIGATLNDVNNQRVAFYKANGDYISFLPSPGATTSFTFTTPAECERVVVGVDSAPNVGADIPNSPYQDSFKLKLNAGSGAHLVAEKIQGVIQTPQITKLDYAKEFENSEFSKDFTFTNNVGVQEYKEISMLASSGVNHLNFATTKENDVSVISAKIKEIASNGSIRLGFGDKDASFQLVKTSTSTPLFDCYLMSRYGIVYVAAVQLGSSISLSVGDKITLFRSGLNILVYVNNTFYSSVNVLNQGSLSGALKGVIGFRDNVQFWKARDIEFRKRKSPYIHISVDDTIGMLSEISVNDVSSIFDNPRMAFYKEMHDKYGAKFSFYCFFQNGPGTFNLTNMQTKWKQEFIDNSSWIKFGFHGVDSTTDYTTIDTPTGVEHYTRIVNEINRFAGYSSIDNMPRFSMFRGNTDLFNALKNYGLVGVLTADDTRANDSGLSEIERTAIRNGDDYFNYINEFYYVRTSPRLDSVDAVGVRSLLDSENSSYNTKNIFEMFYHEGRESNSVGKVMIEEMCKWAVEKGIRFDFPQNNIFF